VGAWRRSGRTPWLLLAGLSGSVAVLMKQSGFDGLVVALAVVLAYGGGRRIRLAGIVLGRGSNTADGVSRGPTSTS